MVEKREIDEGRLIDQTLRLFQNAIAESEAVAPPARFDCAVEGKDLRLSKPPEKRAGSLIGDIVAFARTIAGFESTAVQTAPSSQLPVINSAAASLRQSVGKQISRNELSLESPTQEKTATPIDLNHPQSVARNAMERPAGDERFDPRVDQPPSMVAVVPIESKVPPSLNTADIGAITKPASVAWPPGQPTREGSPVAIKNAHSLVVNKDVVSAQKPVLIKQLLISEPTMAQIPRPSLQPCPKQGLENPIVNAPSDSLADQAKWMTADDKPNPVKAVSPFSANHAEAAGPLRKPIDEPSPPDILPSAHPVQGEPALFDNTLTLVKSVVVSERKTLLVKRISISEFSGVEATSHSLQSPGDKPALGTPTGALQSEALVDHMPCLTATAPIGETDVIEAESPPNMGGTEPLLLQQPINKSVSKEALRSLKRLAQVEPPSPDRVHPTELEGAPAALTTESAESLPEQPPIRQLSPEERLDIELADIRRRVATFKEHQQRFRREREEYYAATTSKACNNTTDASERGAG
ncbi:hypothetical protein [Bradyrhizobium erythrophlei]|uniref:Uncharacterized protein n=1 Tax=Bradyrhizobium erythrophlei TaxID=1437360 RepID=A0A1M5PBP2_9BRAD|nr:hypothetical protein [Bradyrhizobium erythrophlei]SHG98653.1 hypothetical protein SAMN05444169_5122 [Bradyrhizobium erythrophlei]